MLEGKEPSRSHKKCIVLHEYLNEHLLLVFYLP